MNATDHSSPALSRDYRLMLPALPPACVSRETDTRLRLYAETLHRWTQVINLVSERDHDLIWSRHVEESMRLAALLPPGLTRAVDLGSGGGLPALPLSIMSGISFDLIEADRRKAAFLQEVGRITAAPVRVHCCRIEQSGVPPASLVTARALAPLKKLLGYAKPHLTPEGLCLFPKGANVAAELQDARSQWHFSCREYRTSPDPGSVVLAISDVRHV